jgi:hypothetical protein
LLNDGNFNHHRDQQRNKKEQKCGRTEIENHRLLVVRKQQKRDDRQHCARHQHGHHWRHVTVHPIDDLEKNFRRKGLHRPTQGNPRSMEHSSRKSRKNDAD